MTDPSGRRGRSFRRPTLWALAAYLGLYVLLSSAGQFNLANHGGNDWTYRWGPAYLVEPYRTIRSKERLTLLGLAYLPCIAFDRLVWHRSDGDVPGVTIRRSILL